MIKLSPYHEILYNEWKLNPHRYDYNIVIDNEFSGMVDPVRLRRAIQRISQDYFLLQCNIVEANGAYYWKARPTQCVEFSYFEEPLSDDALLSYVKKPFNLSTDSLLRVALIKVTKSKRSSYCLTTNC